MSQQSLALHWKILIGMVLGLVVGLVINLTGFTMGPVGAFLAKLNGFVGDLFVRGLRFVAAPIVLFSLIVGAGGLEDVRKLGRMGLRTLVLYLSTTAVSISVGLVLANVV